MINMKARSVREGQGKTPLRIFPNDPLGATCKSLGDDVSHVINSDIEASLGRNNCKP